MDWFDGRVLRSLFCAFSLYIARHLLQLKILCGAVHRRFFFFPGLEYGAIAKGSQSDTWPTSFLEGEDCIKCALSAGCLIRSDEC